jgi:predicted Zn-dependent protease
MTMLRLKIILLSMLALGGCAVNAVTGERNLQFYGEDWENKAGAELYAPMRQSQGGDYILDAELSAYVEGVGQRLAERARRKQTLSFEFNVLNDSTPNAWALPGGKIAINRGLLLELQSESELAAVLGHEIVHADAAHSARQQSKGMLTQIGAVASMVLISTQVDSEAGQQVAAMVPALGAQLLSQKYGRDAEREADRYGMEYMSEAGYNPQGAVDLQETFVRLSENRRQDWISGLFASHPPSRERVELNREALAGLPEGGETGRDRYRAATARLRRTKPAYDAFDEAREALARDDPETARQKVDQAIRIEPGESLFHAFKGEMEMARGRNSRALAHYNDAVRLNDGFFYNYLGRGEAQLKLDRISAARSDLDRSLELLPSARAHYLLGNLDRRAGRVDTAMDHYKQAAQTDTETGRAAERELVLMDISSNPGKYVAVQAASDSSGQLGYRIGNRTRTPIGQIRMKVEWVPEGGGIKQSTLSYDGVLEGGKQDAVALGYSVPAGTDPDTRLRLTVISARVESEK